MFNEQKEIISHAVLLMSHRLHSHVLDATDLGVIYNVHSHFIFVCRTIPHRHCGARPDLILTTARPSSASHRHANTDPLRIEKPRLYVNVTLPYLL